MDFIDIFNFSKYFKRLNDRKNAKIGHVNEVINELNNVSVKEFIAVTINSDTFTAVKNGIINGKNSYENVDGISLSYNLNDTQWEFFENNVLQAYNISTDDIPPSGLWQTTIGDPINFYIIDYNENIQNHIEYLRGNSELINAAVSELYNEKYKKTIVNISSQEILSMGNTPIILLPAPGFGAYYDIEKIIIEYTFATIPYIFPVSPTFYLDGCFDAYVDKTLLTSSTDTVCILSANLRNTITVGSGSGSVQIKTNKDILNTELILGTPNSDNPINGDGSIRIILYYKINNFSA